MFYNAMKPLYFAAICIPMVTSLAGCNSTDSSAVIGEIQAATVVACAVEPTAASIAALIAALHPAATAGVVVASQIAQEICSALPKPTSGALEVAVVPHSITIHNVPIHFEPIGTAK